MRMQQNLPDRTDHYIMQLTREVRLGRGVKCDSLDELKIKFVAPTIQRQEPPAEPANVPDGFYDGYPEPMTKEDIAKAKLATSKVKIAGVKT